MLNTPSVLALVVLSLFTVRIAGATGLDSLKSIEDRAADYDKFFYGGAAPSKYLDTKISNGIINKTRELRTVIPGVLYRGGGPGGTKPLPQEALQSLCEAGFSVAVYGYTQGFTNGAPTTCTNKLTGAQNSLDYIAVEANEDSAKKTVMGRVYETLQDATKGPVFVHCWNGFHASGELAAIGLRQICPSIWDGDKASKYWLRNADGAPMISRIKKFTPYPQFDVPSDYQQALCQQQN